MKKQYRIKKIVLSMFAFICFMGEAQTLPDSVIMTVGDNKVTLDEFMYIARKNNEVDFSDKKSVNKYVGMFKNFKLKVLEAEKLGLDTTPSFEQELGMYKAQLIAGYMSDKNGEEVAARAIYDRENEYLELSQIMLPFTKDQCVTEDTVRIYERAMEIYNHINEGEHFDTLGIRLSEASQSKQKLKVLAPEYGEIENDILIRYEYIPLFLPMQKLKSFEDVAYSTPVGKVSMPVRTSEGFSLIKVHDRRTNFGYVQVAYINIPYTVDSVKRSKEAVKNLIEEAYEKASSGEDFTTLVKSYSVDTVGDGVLPKYGPGQFLPLIENAVYKLSKPGDITSPLLSEQGAYIFKLIEKKDRPSFDEAKDGIIIDMSKTELNFELYKAFDDYLKKSYNYTFYPEAYFELEELCDVYFPTSDDFWEKVGNMNKTLVVINGEDFPQKEFVHYMQSRPFSAKSYSKDFMKEIFDLFVRDIATVYERKNLEVKHPEISHLTQEYRDGILLFELSNEKIWSNPIEEQAVLEADWLRELNDKYPVKVNSKLLKKLTKKQK
jgi:peptidyl-prolyl cis-trans isomerase SurA